MKVVKKVVMMDHSMAEQRAALKGAMMVVTSAAWKVAKRVDSKVAKKVAYLVASTADSKDQSTVE